MKKLNRILAVLLCAVMIGSMVACNDKPGKVEDYYEFDVSSIRTEMLIGNTQTVAPVLKNLGEVVENAKYGVTVTLEGANVTSTVYNTTTKLFNPNETGTYVFNFVVQDNAGNDVVQNGNKFTRTVEITVVGMTFVQRDVGTEIDDIVIDDSDPTDAKITFGDSYTTKGSTSGQFGISGVNFQGNYKLVYDLDIKGVNAEYKDTQNIGPCLLFGVDRADGRDDNIYLKMTNGQIGCWFWTDNGNVPGGSEWQGAGWMVCKNRVPVEGDYITGKHTLGFTRVIGVEEPDPNAYYIIEFDGEYVCTLNIGLNWSELLSAVWIEDFGVAATVSINSYESLPKTAPAPTVEVEYEPMLAGEAFDLTSGVTFTDSWGCPTLCTVSFEVTDPNGAACTVVNNKFTPQIKGDYTVKVTVADMLGAATTVTGTASTSASFNLGEIAAEQKINQEITVSPNFMLAGDTEKESLTLTLKKDGQAVNNVTINRTGDVFKFTLTAGGYYTLEAVMTLTSSALVTKTFDFAVVDPAAAKASITELSDTTAVGRTDIGHIVYYKVTDTDHSNKTNDAIVEAFKGETDVTADTLHDVVSTTTEADATLRFKVFRPTEAGTYTVKVHYINALGGLAEATHEIVVTDETTGIYGGNVSAGENYNSANMAIGKDGTLIFEHTGATQSFRYVVFSESAFEDEPVEGDWTISFKLTDLWMTGNSASGFAAYVTYGTDVEGKNPASDMLQVGGQNGNDLWGYQTSTIGLSGTIRYEWRGVWQAPVTDEFCPLDENGDPIPFREAPGYTQYATGTHTYRIEFHAEEEVVIDGETVTRAVYYFFIDDVPEARHVLHADHNDYTTVTSVTLYGVNLKAIVTDFSFTAGLPTQA